MQTLKEILLDAARYRWVLENLDQFYAWVAMMDEFPESDKVIDDYIDGELDNDS